MKILNKFLKNKKNKKDRQNHLNLVETPNILEVKEYYEKETEAYLDTYGDIIQYSRPTFDEQFLDYLIDSIGINDGMRILDAGCGVCGPSIYFAKKKNIKINAVTIAEIQVEIAKQKIKQSNLEDKITVSEGDFHELDKQFSPNIFDLLYFLESFGYVNNQKKVLESAFSILKPSGFIYIKDAFTVPLIKEDQIAVQLKISQQIRQEYAYKVLDLVSLITDIRELGGTIVHIKKMDMPEDFTIPATFELKKGYQSYTNAINNPYRLYQALELKFQKE